MLTCAYCFKVLEKNLCVLVRTPEVYTHRITKYTNLYTQISKFNNSKTIVSAGF